MEEKRGMREREGKQSLYLPITGLSEKPWLFNQLHHIPYLSSSTIPLSLFTIPLSLPLPLSPSHFILLTISVSHSLYHYPSLTLKIFCLLL